MRNRSEGFHLRQLLNTMDASLNADIRCLGLFPYHVHLYAYFSVAGPVTDELFTEHFILHAGLRLVNQENSSEQSRVDVLIVMVNVNRRGGWVKRSANNDTISAFKSRKTDIPTLTNNEFPLIFIEKSKEFLRRDFQLRYFHQLRLKYPQPPGGRPHL